MAILINSGNTVTLPPNPQDIAVGEMFVGEYGETLGTRVLGCVIDKRQTADGYVYTVQTHGVYRIAYDEMYDPISAGLSVRYNPQTRLATNYKGNGVVDFGIIVGGGTPPGESAYIDVLIK